MKRSFPAVCVLSVCMLSAIAAENGYHLLNKVPLGPAEGGSEYFDYINVDASARRAYLSHGTEFLVVDVEKGDVLGKIGGFKRNHGIALVPTPGQKTFIE